MHTRGPEYEKDPVNHFMCDQAIIKCTVYEIHNVTKIWYMKIFMQYNGLPRYLNYHTELGHYIFPQKQ